MIPEPGKAMTIYRSQRSIVASYQLLDHPQASPLAWYVPLASHSQSGSAIQLPSQSGDFGAKATLEPSFTGYMYAASPLGSCLLFFYHIVSDNG